MYHFRAASPWVDSECMITKRERHRNVGLTRNDKITLTIRLGTWNLRMNGQSIVRRSDDQCRAYATNMSSSTSDKQAYNVPVSRTAVRPAKPTSRPLTVIDAIFASQNPSGLIFLKVCSVL